VIRQQTGATDERKPSGWGGEIRRLEHLLDGRRRFRQTWDFCLPQTWRLHPKVCKYTAEFFYDDKLRSHSYFAE